MSMEINKLNKQIDNAKGTYRYTLMQQHKELCNQHQRASKIKGIFGSRNTQFLNMVKEQNNKTREYREYIINNFGIKGKQWGEKLKNRKFFIDILLITRFYKYLKDSIFIKFILT